MNTLPSSLSLCPYAGGRKEGDGKLADPLREESLTLPPPSSVLSFFLFHGPLPEAKTLFKGTF